MIEVIFKDNEQKILKIAQGAIGESLLDIALSNDVPLAHACGGFCSCTTCHVKVLSGAQHLTAIEEDEHERMDSSLDQRFPDSRLGCQARIKSENGQIAVEIQNLDQY